MSHGMTTREKLKTCRTTKDALLVLADEIDALRASFEQTQDELWTRIEHADFLGEELSWDDGDDYIHHTDSISYAEEAEQGYEEEHPSLVPEIDQEALAAVNAAIQECTDPDTIRALKAKAYLIRHPGIPMGARVGDAEREVEMRGDEVVLPEASPGRKMVRRNLARTYRIWEAFEPVQDEDEITEAYAKGGPLWMYLTNPKAVNSLPEAARRQMVQDIEQDSPRKALEVGRDILKARQGVSQKFAVEAQKRATALRTGDTDYLAEAE